MYVEAEFVWEGDVLNIVGVRNEDGRKTRQSWRSMLLMQPPATAMSVGEQTGDLVEGPLPNERAVATVWNPKGLTFGDLEDVEEMFSRQRKRFPEATGRTGRVSLVLGKKVEIKDGTDGEVSISPVLEHCSENASGGKLCKCLRTLLEPNNDDA